MGAPSGNPRDVVVFVHGTFACSDADEGTAWWQRGSDFWNWMKANLPPDTELPETGPAFRFEGNGLEEPPARRVRRSGRHGRPARSPALAAGPLNPPVTPPAPIGHLAVHRRDHGPAEDAREVSPTRCPSPDRPEVAPERRQTKCPDEVPDTSKRTPRNGTPRNGLERARRRVPIGCFRAAARGAGPGGVSGHSENFTPRLFFGLRSPRSSVRPIHSEFRLWL